MAEIVGFDPAQVGDSSGDGIEFTEDDLELLRAVTSGTAGKAGEGASPVDDLLAKLGVATENEAIEYAITLPHHRTWFPSARVAFK